MKKAIVPVFIALLVLVGVSAGQAQYQKSKNFAGPHLGLSGVGSTFSFGADYEYGVTENIGVGGLFDYWSYNFSNLGFTSDFSYKYMTIAATGSWHFIIPNESKWDPFAGLALGYYVVSVTKPAGFKDSPLYSFEASRIFFGLQGGVRYFFTPTIAGQARVGFGAYILAVGVDFKF